jgi:HrpA-like RNA helicase
VGPLGIGFPQLPHAAVNQELLPFREVLPIWPMRDEIMNLINSNQVVVVSGDTGSGKTTQVTCLPDKS